MFTQASDADSTSAMRRLGTCLRGKYQLDRLLGIGGMGAVFAARHRIGGSYAIKILHDASPNRCGTHDAFLREALLANRVEHPGALRVIDADVAEDGSPFYVMPLLEGETLRRRAARFGGRLPPGEAVAFALSVLETLAAAHAKGIVHRDIKPENLFLTHSDGLKVLDFGIARLFKTPETDVTHSGRAVGTPGFMAPEQALGQTRQIDGRTDLWAVGATMFSLLSGRLVHEGETWSEIAAYAATRPAPLLSTVTPEVPPALGDVVDRALRFSRPERWPDATHMGKALREACIRAGITIPDLSVLSIPPDPDGNEHILVTERSRVPTEPIEPPDPLGPPRDRLHRDEDSLRAANTRTQSRVFPTAPRTPASDLAKEPIPGAAIPRPRRRTRALVGAALVLTAAIAWPTAGRIQAGLRHSVERAFVSGSDSGTRAAAPELEAAAAFQTALESWKLGDSREAFVRLRKAIDIDADYAPAHLMSILFADNIEVKLRKRYAIARSHVWMLSSRDHELLDAVAPAMSDPPDWDAMVRAFQSIHDKSPSDPLVTTLFAHKLIAIGRPERALPILEATDVPWPIADDLRAKALVALGRESEAETTLKRCIAATPNSTTCIPEMAAIASRTGRCEDLEWLAKQLIALTPDSPDGYAFLATNQYTSGRPIGEIHATLAERWRRVAEPLRELQTLEDRAFLNFAYGDIANARRSLTDWQSLVAAEADGNARVLPLLLQAAMFGELGDEGAAQSAAIELQEQSASFPWSDWSDAQANALQLRYSLHIISRHEMVRERDALLSKRASAAYSDSRRWLNYFAGMVESAEDAREAFATMPTRLPSLFERDAGIELSIGRMYTLVGKPDEARQWLILASSQCGIEDFVTTLQATYSLGLALEHQNRTNEACGAFADAVGRGSRLPRSRTVNEAQAHLRKLHCGPSTR